MELLGGYPRTTSTSSADVRMANSSYMQKVTDMRVDRQKLMGLAKWYAITEDQRREILFPPPRKVQINYSHASSEQLKGAESSFMGGGMVWRPPSPMQNVRTMGPPNNQEHLSRTRFALDRQKEEQALQWGTTSSGAYGSGVSPMKVPGGSYVNWATGSKVLSP
mmetsp:Transcript_47227/g.94071  ORF Transcript_47227/g.94071 Transcript_47227/m.94071 type:complete len:164 (-) Transcript_47227:240-731(-)|eukprot:CAMPEP_0174725028 /NCGR_PEP_ID=MMETSP1094-20130205/44677_1 /TAXON_ID=156173 /ORGANISM="Chrysochromulina brevifilum, Strain UTEX LB 985" /LENGTH=163 /DNA_ID=CAMNT_0015926341 /DNA_START=132 /DNA_END=623 /DNA_ORIENTATION=+